MAGQSDTVQQQDTLNRYLLYFPRSKTVSPDVHSFCGEEELSKPYRYTIRFTSPNPNIAVKDVLNKMAEFILRAPNPKAKSTWHNQESWLPVRQINGVITSFSRLKSSADEALYECMLEHELALLDRNYRSAVYMDMTVPELVTKLMKESGHFQGYNIDFDQLSHNYPSREMIIQWKETDLQFIRRLLAEVGIWFRFENHDKVQGETVVIFGDGSRRYVFSNKKLPYVRHSGMTSHEEYVTELEERYQLIPENVLVRTYNYRDPFSPQADKTIAGNDIPHGITRGKQYHYADHFLAAGDFYGQEAETASFYARLRYERLLNKQSVLGVTGVTDVETTVPVYLRAEVVSKPKQLWYTGLSRTEKYPLLEVLDEKKAVPDRLDLEMSLGEHSAGYVWLMLALASDAVVYAQGDQLVAASEQNRFSMTALSSRLTRQPDYPQQKRYTTPWEVCGIAGLMFFFGIMITIGTFGEGGKSISGWFLIIVAVLCIVIFCGMGAFFT
ncbi:TPA: type VI secretion system Vgr family protein [Enterobacter hormaechei]